MGYVSSCSVTLERILARQRDCSRKHSYFVFPLRVTFLKPFVLWSKIAPQTQEITEDHTQGIPLTHVTGSRNSINFLAFISGKTDTWAQSNPSTQSSTRLACLISLHLPFLCYSWDYSLSHTVVLVAIERSSEKFTLYKMNYIAQSSICKVMYEGSTELSYCLT